ncbi:MAG: D-aminoacyl-tRNA deacylase [Nitrososphaerota archaeon]
MAGPVILISRADPSSMLVRDYLVETLGFEPAPSMGREILRGRGISAIVLDSHHLFLSEKEILEIEADLIVVASAHRSESGTKALTTHATGNWTGDASMGGKPRALSHTLAGAIRSAFEALSKGVEENSRLNGWWVGLEVTHHGPYSPLPLIYVEFGGPVDARADRDAAGVVAEACIEACHASPSRSAAVGIGGGHYAPTFTRLMAEGEHDFGHILPKYSLPEGLELLGEAVERVADGCRAAVLDWKGIQGPHRGLVVERLQQLGVEIIKR